MIEVANGKKIKWARHRVRARKKILKWLYTVEWKARGEEGDQEGDGLMRSELVGWR